MSDLLSLPDRRVSAASQDRPATLILAIGNAIMGDDGLGAALGRRLESRLLDDTRVIDGGTCGLALLPYLEDADRVIFLDAARMGHPPGTVTVLEGRALNEALGRITTTAHEIALADLIGAAMLTGALPDRFALVAVEPQTVAVGTTLSAPVEAALPAAEAAVRGMLARWAA